LAARLRELSVYAGQVERQLAEVRRPAALRGLVAVALGNWFLWAAKLACDTKVDISSAWRTLEQAADLGLVVAVPGQKRSRGDGTLYAAPPWLRMAGLGSAIAELEAAMATAGRLTGTIAAAGTDGWNAHIWRKAWTTANPISLRLVDQGG